ncbi:MAG: hypothetical protein EA367_15825 [Leptolyngbya sp. DLM2.Bin15]|nr:MAG: hypothetical protein EA367_15825 [Leptolyngbya sp. DLM2.Bin15]
MRLYIPDKLKDQVRDRYPDTSYSKLVEQFIRNWADSGCPALEPYPLAEHPQQRPKGSTGRQVGLRSHPDVTTLTVLVSEDLYVRVEEILIRLPNYWSGVVASLFYQHLEELEAEDKRRLQVRKDQVSKPKRHQFKLNHSQITPIQLEININLGLN